MLPERGRYVGGTAGSLRKSRNPPVHQKIVFKGADAEAIAATRRVTKRQREIRAPGSGGYGTPGTGSPAHASGDLEGSTVEGQRAAAHGYIAYSGPFSVDDEMRILTHHVSVCLLPNWIGDTQERLVQLEGDILTLSAAPMR